MSPFRERAPRVVASRRRTSLGDIRSLMVRILCCSTIFATIGPLLARPKVDIVFLKNGDRLTCEIKTLAQGELTVASDYASGSIFLDWREVARIESPQRFQLETTDGTFYTGTLSKPSAESKIRVAEGGSSASVALLDVVEVRQLERTQLGRLDLDVDYGFNFQKANSNTQSNLSADFGYSTAVWTFSNDTSISSSFLSSGEDTKRIESKNFYTRNFSRRWFSLAVADVLNNSEQDLVLRSTLGAGLGRNMIQTQNTSLLGAFGLAYTLEKFGSAGLEPGSDQDVRGSAEALLKLAYERFDFDSTAFSFDVLVNPSLTDLGRVRVDIGSDLKLKLFSDDLYIKFSIFSNFDSRPPAATAKTDYGVSTSVGWSIF